MISLLSKIFIKSRDNYSDSTVRYSYGILCSVVGIFLNVILCILKLAVSTLTGSVSVAADAFNNLSDAGSSAVTLVGFRLSKQKPDPGHPFGHGRFEYISGFIVSIFIVFMGFELARSSVSKILDKTDVKFSAVSAVVLGVSILVKLYMFLYNKGISKKINSPAMKATATDSLSDCVSTAVVLVCTFVDGLTSLNVDGICGIAVSLFILWSGIMSAKEMIDLLLGTPPDKEFIKQIERTVMSYPNILGIHDLIVHNYGPGRVMISLHAEVPQNMNIVDIHDTIDNIEKHISDEMGCHAVIHMDPIAVDDAQTTELKNKVALIVKEIDPAVAIHDFRVVIGQTHTNMIFDMVVPFDIGYTDEELKNIVGEKIRRLSDTFFTVVNIDKDYNGK